jgi:PAS domain S-box-containing protein
MRRTRHSHQQSRMADAAAVMIWQSDPDRRSTYVNQAWRDFTGRTSEQEAGTGWVAGVHPDDVERCLAAYLAAFDAGQDFELEYRLRRHDGKFRWVLDRGIRLRGDDDSFLGYIGGCVDITERKHLEGLERELLLDAVRTQIGAELHDHASQTSFATALITSAALAELGRLVRCFQQRTGIDADVVMTSRSGPLPPAVAATLQSVAHEALADVERRAKATAVILGVRVAPRSVTLCIQDDVGFLARARVPFKPGAAVTWLRNGRVPPTPT